jgi:hypothetical protein
VLGTRLIPLLAAPITLYLVATRRSPVEQGFYFVLVNVQALASLVELGVGTIVVQFISHESPSLRWRADGALEGDEQAVARALAVVREGWRWYGWLAALLVLAGAAGAFAFGRGSVEGGAPLAVAWAVVVLATAGYVPLVPLLCAIEGAHGLIRVQSVRLVQAGLGLAALWTGLLTIGALPAVAAFAVVWLLVPALWLGVAHRAFVRQMLAVRSGSSSLTSVQWRTGVSWLVLWASPQLLVQIVLATSGAADAGRLGMSLAIATAPATLAGAWLQSRYPRFAATLAQSGRAALDALARRSTAEALGVCTLGGIAVTAVAALLQRSAPALGARLLATESVAALCATGLAWIAIQALAGYLRADRDEPLLLAMAGGAAVAVSATALAASRGVETAVRAYSLAVLFIAVPIVVLAFAAERSRRLARAGSDPASAPRR